MVVAEPAFLTAERLCEYLPRQRWFAAKDRRIASICVVKTVAWSHGVIACLVDVGLVDIGLGAESQRYFLPLYAEGETIEDATASPSFVHAALAAMRIPVGSGAAIRPMGPMGVEQSNTSIQVGDTVALKVYRRPVAGVHPEIEIGRFLTDVAHYANAPKLLGSVEMSDETGAATAVIAAQGLVPHQSDGWSFTEALLRRELEDKSRDDLPPAERFAPYLRRVDLLGERTAQLHRAFAAATGDPAFDPESVTADGMTALCADIAATAERAFSIVARTNLSERFLMQRDECLAWIGACSDADVHWSRTRHHGDFHLGQILVTDDDVMLIDFEGEPTRSLDDRRAKKSPLRDVAGMIRSFDYAAWVALQSSAKAHITVMAWRDLAVRRFVQSYLASIGDCVSLPRAPTARRRLIDLLVLEKALFEITYESAHRPAWLPIPISGVLAVMDAVR